MAGSAVGSQRANASLDFSIVIPAMVRVQGRAAPRALAVTSADIARGYVDIEDMSSVTVTSNANSGFALGIDFDTDLVRAVDVRIDGATLKATQRGMSLPVHVGRLAAATMQVGYRIFLASGARGGSYRWPIALFFYPSPA
ncbi:MAG TPA: hypothetical protein VH040_08820 [Usitatibacter sp.]|nr:hypothetical protein [Usitatibacter sp.]